MCKHNMVSITGLLRSQAHPALSSQDSLGETVHGQRKHVTIGSCFEFFVLRTFLIFCISFMTNEGVFVPI